MSEDINSVLNVFKTDIKKVQKELKDIASTFYLNKDVIILHGKYKNRKAVVSDIGVSDDRVVLELDIYRMDGKDGFLDMYSNWSEKFKSPESVKLCQ